METSKREELTDAIDTFDLPGYIARAYPESGAHPGRAGPIKASWRDDQNPSASLIKSNRTRAWIVKDHATGEVFNAWQFLTQVEGYSNDEALQALGIERNAPDLQKPVPLARDLVPVAPEVQEYQPPESLKGRGFKPKELQAYGVTSDEGDALIPITGIDGQVYNVKRKLLVPQGKMRYKYEFTGHKAPVWFSPNFLESKVQLWIEGELNAMITHAVLTENDVHAGVAGVPGVNAHLPDVPLSGKVVYYYADEDAAGLQLARRFPKWAVGQGAQSVTRIPPLGDGVDFCDLAGEARAKLHEYLDGAWELEPELTILDREVHDGYTIGELREHGRKYISGELVRTSGYIELDAFTGGLPFSGVISWAALPSFGKSIALRDLCLHQAMNGERVYYFSPDQSVPEMIVFMASKLSGVPANQLRSNNYSPLLLDLHGSPEAVRKAWADAYDHCLLRISQNFRISESGDMRFISERVARAVDEGYTFFAADYGQILEYYDDRGREVDGRAINEVKKLTRDHKIPFLVALQLAKYKFPKGSTRDPLPYPGDIEGRGSYYQASEQMYMIWDHELYEREYGGPETPYPDGIEHDKGKVRIYVRKNKTGPWGDFRYLRKRPELGTFLNMTEGVDG